MGYFQVMGFYWGGAPVNPRQLIPLIFTVSSGVLSYNRFVECTLLLSVFLPLSLPSSFMFLHVFLQLTNTLFAMPTQNASLSPMPPFSHSSHFSHQKKVIQAKTSRTKLQQFTHPVFDCIYCFVSHQHNAGFSIYSN